MPDRTIAHNDYVPDAEHSVAPSPRLRWREWLAALENLTTQLPGHLTAR